MTGKCRQMGFVVAVAVASLAVPSVASAQAYPSRPIRLLSGGAPGGAPDISARLIASEISKQMNQQVVVDNRPGASGIISLEVLARAAPDGYTLGQLATNFVTNPSLYAKLPYDSAKDFQPIIHTGASTYILAVAPSLPIRSAKDLIEYARVNPGKLSYGGLGIGSVQVLTMELLKFQTNTDIVLVAYKGAQQAITDVIGGQIHLICDPMSSIFPFVRSGKLRGLGVTTPKRSLAAPELPTIDESGVPGYEAQFRAGGIVAPAKVPREVVMRLNTEINKALRSPAVAEKFAANGYTGGGGTPEHYSAQLQSETAKWVKVIKAMDVKPG